jgi:predicted outer membrane repeat protein
MSWITPGFSSFLVDCSSSSARSGGAISGMGCMVLQLFAVGENRPYPEFWVVTGDL